MENEFEKIGKEASKMKTHKVYTPKLGDVIKWIEAEKDHNNWCLEEETKSKHKYKIMKRINGEYSLYSVFDGCGIPYRCIDCKNIENIKTIANILRNDKR